MTKKTNTFEQLKHDYESAKELARTTNNAVVVNHEMFNPQNVRGSLINTKAHIAAVLAVQNSLDLASYKVLYNAYVDGIFNLDSYTDSKGNEVAYKNFEEWAQKTMNIKRSTAYAAVKVGKYITDDAKATTLPHGEKDYTFSHLVALVECKELYDIDGKEKTIKTVPLEECERDKDGRIKYESVYDDKGKPIYSKPILKPVFDENGEQVNGDIITYLCLTNVINPYLSVREMKKAIKEHLNPAFIDVDDIDNVDNNTIEYSDDEEQIEASTAITVAIDDLIAVKSAIENGDCAKAIDLIDNLIA